MQRWNGWGDDTMYVDLPIQGHNLLRKLLGIGNVKADYPLEKFINSIPTSRLPHHPLISTNPKERLDHSHGQSLPDWISLRGGTLQHFPDGVAQPSTTEEVLALLDFSGKHDAVVIPFGGGTSVVGHLQVPEGDRPVLSLSLKRLNRLIDLSPNSLLATFESGILGIDIEAHLMTRGFKLGHYPQSFEFSSLGGWVATRSTGQQSLHYGRIEQLFAGGELVTPKGILKIPPFPASAAGPDLRHIVFFFPSWDYAKDAVQTLAGAGIPFSMIRLSNSAETMTNLALAGHGKQIALMRGFLRLRGIPGKGACMCLVGFIGTKRFVKTARRESFSILWQYKGVSVGKVMGEAWKKNRFRMPYLRNTLWDMGYAVDTLETAVTWDKVTTTMEEIEKAIKESMAPWNEKVHVFSHLSHVYSTGSSIYTTYMFRLSDTPEETLARWKTIKKAASQAIVKAGGTISHQHGVGVDHKPYLEAEKGSVGMSAIRQLCNHLDPENRMNPYKLFD
jgi:alkyldihydroxyacetonephosphate synthase